ncbi:hypothetical protein TCAL_06224, partial [Tigriopus californicus]
MRQPLTLYVILNQTVVCQLRLQLAKADHPDGFEHDVAFVPDSELLNDGSVRLVSNWKSAIFSIPPTLNTNHRAQVLANYGSYVGFAALDDIKITTREMCSPMWVKFPGFGFQSDILSKVDTSLDDFEMTGIDAQMLLEKYAMISSTATLEACTRRCYFGSGCDMVEIDPITLTCRFYPHLGLKNEPWFTIVQDNAPTDLYVLQCSTSQENILYNNDFWTTINAPWQVDHNCSKAELGLNSALNEEIGSQTSNAMGTWDFECNTNQGFEVRATLDLDLFPLGIDQAYLNSVNMAGLVVGWAQGLSNPINVNQGFEYKLDIEDGNPIVINQMESTTQWPLSKSLNSVSNQLSKTVSFGYLSQYPAQQSRVVPINFLVDMPFGLGCFGMTQEALSTFGAPILAPDMTPVQCLTTCATTFPSPQKRFSGLSNANECRCFEELPNPDLTLLPDLACSTPCTGDDHQFCGGNTTNVLNFFVARCPENQQRFGDYCYVQNDQDLSIEENADFCSEQEMHLFWPNSIAEILFLSEIMPKAQRHLGFMYVLDNDGIVAVDGSILVGNGATHLPLDGSPIISPSDDYQMTNNSCHILDLDNRVRSLSPCTLLTGALCKAKIAKGAGSEYLGSIIHVEVYSPIQTAPQESFGIGLPIRVELQESAYIQNKWIDLKFPHKIVLRALQIETLKAKFLKSFHLKVAEASFAQSTEFTYIEFKTGKPVLFHVFHTSFENMNNVMQRTIHLVRPRMTRHIQLELVESALEVAINLDIIGMPAKKAYAANKYLEQDHEFQRRIDLNQPGYDINPNTPLYPNGRLFYRGWINDMSLSKDILRLEFLTPTTKYFNVLVSAEDSVYTLLITSNLITNPPSGSIEWQNYRPSQTLTLEIEVQFSPDSLDLFFKGDLIDTFLFNSDFLNEPIFSRMTQETNATTSRIQFTSSREISNPFCHNGFIQLNHHISVLQYGAFDEFKMRTNVDFPSVFDPPTLTPLDVVVDKDEGLLFQIFGDPSSKNFGYIPFEFKQNCFETPNGNVKCVPGSGIMSTQSFGGSPGVNNPTVCPTGYDHLGKICMKTYTTLPTHNHGDAQSYCSPDHIYVPMDQDHNRLFRAVMKSMEATLPVPEIWIGVTRFANGSWITEEGIELSPSISDWAPGYPNELDSQANCVMASNVHGFKWINGACNQLKTVYCSYAEKLPYCPRSYEWFPEIPDSCFRISSAANHLIATNSYSSSIHIAEDMCQMEHTRLYVVETLEQGRALALWVANSPRVSSIYSTIWSGMHEAELGAYIFADQYEPSTSLSEDPAFFAEGGADRSCLRMIVSSGDPSQIGRVHTQECASISNHMFYGVCQYTQCIAQSRDLCQFPFRYQNRMYDSCITLGSLDGSPWCSGSTDTQFNHLPGSELQCPETCKVNHCPIGYRRMYKDQSCYKLSPPYPSKTKSSVDEAQAECNKDGAKLLEPRSEDFWTHFLKLESHSFLTGQHFKHNAETSFVALGLFIDFSTGTPVVQYADGTVPYEPLEGTDIPWRTGFPENDPSKACVALMSPDGKLINTPCQGYSDGDITGHGTLGYLCEARPTEATNEAGDAKVCHFPFAFDGVVYHGCIGPDVAAPDGVEQPWCATEVDGSGVLKPGMWAFCSDERSIAYSGFEGQYCSVPFLMNKRFYDTCTRQTPDAFNVMQYHWCANKLNTSLEIPYESGLKGKCSGFLIPEDSGCPDHYDMVGGNCVRISTYPVTFDEAHSACLADGGELLTILQDQMTQDIQALLEQKRKEFEHYSTTEFFWVGAEYQNGWNWMDSRSNGLQPFDAYTNWESNTPDLGCPIGLGCSTDTRLVVQAASGYTWKAAQKDELMGYICQSICPSPFRWSGRLGSTVPEAIVDCARSNATLFPFRNCNDLDNLRLSLLEIGAPVDSDYTIGGFYGITQTWNSKGPVDAEIQDSMGHSLEGVLFDVNQGLCLVQHGTLPFGMQGPMAFGVFLDASQMFTYHHSLSKIATRLHKSGYVCKIDEDFACPQGYYKYVDSCFKFVHDSKLSMVDASISCQENYEATLANISQNLEAQVLAEFIKEEEPRGNTTQYWLGTRLERDSITDPFEVFSDPLLKCNCASSVNFFKHGNKCFYKEWTPMGFEEAKTSCESHGGTLATGLDQDSLDQIFQYEETNPHVNGMWVGAATPVYPGFQCSESGPTFCQYHWTDPANTPIDPVQFSFLQSDKNSTCIRITNNGLSDEFCNTKLESLCARDSCLPEPEPNFAKMRCAIMERFGPIHRILPSQCLDQIGYVCRKDQIGSAFSKKTPVESQLILPLAKGFGLQDQSGQNTIVSGTKVGFSSQWVKTHHLGAALFGGQTHLDMATGLTGGTGFTIFFTISIWDNTATATIMDFRPSYDLDQGLLIEWRDGSPVFILRNNVGPKEFRVIDSSKLTDLNTFATFGITFDVLTNRGTIFRDNVFGFQNDTDQFANEYFDFDPENWFQTALLHGGRIGASRIDPTLNPLHGALSCIQIYNHGMTPGQILEKDTCGNEFYPICPTGQFQWNDNCFKVSIIPATFARAEANCMAMGSNGYKSELIHMIEADLLDHLSRVVQQSTGQSAFWVGLEQRSGLGYFESTDGTTRYNSTDDIWVEPGSPYTSQQCARVPGLNGGYLETKSCDAENHYVCQRKGLNQRPDDPCPMGFAFYRGTCLLPSKEAAVFEDAQEYCASQGAKVHASKTNSQFEFIKEYAGTEIGRDIWMGVQKGLKEHFIDPSMDEPLRLTDGDGKFYSDGTPFEDQTDFSFKMTSSSGHWDGPCVYLRTSVGYRARNALCSREYAFICEWKEPTCPVNYRISPELGPRSCYRTITSPGPFTANACEDPADELRHLAWPESLKALEKFRELTETVTGSIWIGGEFFPNQTWINGRGETIEIPGDYKDMSLLGNWYQPPLSDSVSSGCLKMNANGLLRNSYDNACQNASHPYACEYKACFTVQGKQCVFPFPYRNVSTTGIVTELQYTKCSTLDVYSPWCATELDVDGNIVDWDFCVQDCPSEIVEVACLSEPEFPALVNLWDGSDFVNFTANYEQGSGMVTKELDFVSFNCPQGYVFEGSNNVTHYALCHNWEYHYLFDRNARCQRVTCACPPRFSRDSVVYGTTDWGNQIYTCQRNESFPLNASITYSCPEGYVFETPEFLAFGDEKDELFVICETYADWNITHDPKCIPINCTDSPPIVPNDPKGVFDWDFANKSYLHQINYRCPLSFWGYPSTGAHSETIYCMSNKRWSIPTIEDCQQLPCKYAPPKVPEGGWFWFDMDRTKYKCPHGYEFEDGSFPFVESECAANRLWSPQSIKNCTTRKCQSPPALPYMWMDMDWPHRSSKLGVRATYRCPYKKETPDGESRQYSTCMWDKDSDNMMWYPIEIQRCS